MEPSPTRKIGLGQPPPTVWSFAYVLVGTKQVLQRITDLTRSAVRIVFVVIFILVVGRHFIFLIVVATRWFRLFLLKQNGRRSNCRVYTEIDKLASGAVRGVGPSATGQTLDKLHDRSFVVLVEVSLSWC